MVTSSKGEASGTDFYKGSSGDTLAIPAIRTPGEIAVSAIRTAGDYDFEIVATDLTVSRRNLPAPGS